MGADDSADRSSVITNVLPLESRRNVPSDDASVPLIRVDHIKNGSCSIYPNDEFTRSPEDISPYLEGVTPKNSGSCLELSCRSTS